MVPGPRPLGLREGRRSPWGSFTAGGALPAAPGGALAEGRRPSQCLMHKVKGGNRDPEAGRAPSAENCVFSPWFSAGFGRNGPRCTWQFPRGGVSRGARLDTQLGGCRSLAGGGLPGQDCAPWETGRLTPGKVRLGLTPVLTAAGSLRRGP